MRTAVEVLTDEYVKVGGKIFADYFLRLKANDEQKRTIEANDFLLGMLEGNFKKEWKLEETSDYKALVELANAINLLAEV